MSRDHSRVNLALWRDPDFRALPPAAQHLYLLLWTSPGLTYCGVHDWRPNRLTGLSAGMTVESVMASAACLQARHFLVIDESTEEALIRSWARFDGLLKQPRMAVSYVNAYAIVASSTLRQVLVHETQKIQTLSPDLACWSDPRVAEVLGHPSVSAKDLPPVSDPFAGPFGDGVAPDLALGLPQTQGKVWGSVSTPPTTATATTTDSSATPSKPRKRGTQIPQDWAPNEKHAAIADAEGVDLGREAIRFRDHFTANGKTHIDWDAAFRNWLRNDQYRPKPDPRAERPRSLPTADQLEEPPDGLTPEEYRDWHAAQRAKRAHA